MLNQQGEGKALPCIKLLHAEQKVLSVKTDSPACDGTSRSFLLFQYLHCSLSRSRPQLLWFLGVGQKVLLLSLHS